MNVTVAANCNVLPSPGACGGALTGRYCYTGFCVDESKLLLNLQAVCNGAGGVVTFSNTAGTVNGSVDFVGSAVTRAATLTLSGTATIPPVCAVAGCAAVQSAFTAAGATANCSSSGGGCSCAWTSVLPTGTASAFTTAGGTLTVGSRSYDYCVQGGLQYRETTANDVAEPGVATLTR